MAAFCRETCTLDDSKDGENMNLIRVKHISYEIIGVYISHKANHSNVIRNLNSMIDMSRPTVIIGDIVLNTN